MGTGRESVWVWESVGNGAYLRGYCHLNLKPNLDLNLLLENGLRLGLGLGLRLGLWKVGDREREGVSGLHLIWCRSRRDEAFGQIGRQAAEIMKVERVDPVRLGLARTLDQ